MQENPVLDMAIDFVNNTSRHIFLTGKAGTGKTTFLKFIRENTPKKCVVVAPTGVAAINAGGVTMHSFFQLPLGPYVPVATRFSANGYTDKNLLFKNIRLSEEKRELIRDLDLIIIDEVSMVRCDTLDAMDAILRHFRKRNNVPFGGVQLLYIGDLFQLPPVMPEQEWSVLQQYYGGPFFFHSKAVEQAKPVYIELKKVYRQTERRFIDLLNRIRNDETNSSDYEILNSRYRAPVKAGERYITLTTHNYKADRINMEELQKLPGKLYELKGMVEGDFPDKTLPTEISLQLKEGAQVMFIRNDKSEEHRYFNGKLATVKKVAGDNVTVVFADSETELLLEKETWNNIRYSYNSAEEKIEEEKLGSFTQYPVRLAWAITVHKSQGLTFQNAIIDAGDSFAPGQVYVALSRCTSLDGMVLHSKIHSRSISTDPQVIAFAKHEAQADEMAIILEEEKRLFLNRSLVDAFDFSRLAGIMEKYAEYVQGKKIPDPKSASDSAIKMLTSINEMTKVSFKFQEQLTGILAEGDDEKLIDRVSKAIDYFNKVIVETVLEPLNSHIDSLKGVAKVRKYLKQVRLLRASVVKKIQEIQTLRYGDMQFMHSPVAIAPDSEVVSRHGKAQKGESLRETLALFQTGLKAPEIAKQRELAVSTIEGHVAMLVKSGDIRIEDVVEERKLAMIIEAAAERNGSITSVKQKLGDAISFGEVRAVLNHLQFIQEEKLIH